MGKLTWAAAIAVVGVTLAIAIIVTRDTTDFVVGPRVAAACHWITPTQRGTSNNGLLT